MLPSRSPAPLHAFRRAGSRTRAPVHSATTVRHCWRCTVRLCARPRTTPGRGRGIARWVAVPEPPSAGAWFSGHDLSAGLDLALWHCRYRRCRAGMTSMHCGTKMMRGVRRARSCRSAAEARSGSTGRCHMNRNTRAWRRCSQALGPGSWRRRITHERPPRSHSRRQVLPGAGGTPA